MRTRILIALATIAVAATSAAITVAQIGTSLSALSFHTHYWG